ncbi:MAG: DUF1294 domain-containing protein [Phycisphaerae bacterium]|nr:DUF1294 domain-containing protein [Phycisphaerae bacterium]
MISNPYKSFVLVAVILLAIFCIVLWRLTSLHPAWIYLIAVSAIAFLFYGYDKVQARRNGGRIPEVVLHLLALAGGTIGAFLGQFLFRHKTKKWEFRLVFILIVIVQLGLIVWWTMKG